MLGVPASPGVPGHLRPEARDPLRLAAGGSGVRTAAGGACDLSTYSREGVGVSTLSRVGVGGWTAQTLDFIGPVQPVQPVQL